MTMITKEEFLSYVRVQESGVTNMFDVNNVTMLSGLTREQYFDIMKNYDKYNKEYVENEKM
jgi:hypothetical protein